MLRPFPTAILATLGLALAGCCCEPRRSCCPAPCPCPPTAAAPVAMRAGAPAGAVEPTLIVTTESTGRIRLLAGTDGHLVLGGTDGRVVLEGNVVIVGPDGKPVEGAVVAQQRGQVVLFVEEGEEDDDDGDGKDGKDEAREGKGSKDGAAAATKPAPADGRGYLGFSPFPVELFSPEQRAQLKGGPEHGVVALRVFPGSPAAKAGLRAGDVILAYAGKDVPSTKDLDPKNPEGAQAFAAEFAKIAGTTRPGVEMSIVVQREGKPVTLKATPVDLAAMQKLAAAAGGDFEEDEDDEADEGKEGPEKDEGKEGAPAPK